jgi:hypothetical protein
MAQVINYWILADMTIFWFETDFPLDFVAKDGFNSVRIMGTENRVLRKNER